MDYLHWILVLSKLFRYSEIQSPESRDLRYGGRYISTDVLVVWIIALHYEVTHSVNNTGKKAKTFFYPKEGYKIIYGVCGSFKSLAQLNKSPTFSDNLGQKSLPIGIIL